MNAEYGGMAIFQSSGFGAAASTLTMMSSGARAWYRDVADGVPPALVVQEECLLCLSSHPGHQKRMRLFARMADMFLGYETAQIYGHHRTLSG